MRQRTVAGLIGALCIATPAVADRSCPAPPDAVAQRTRDQDGWALATPSPEAPIGRFSIRLAPAAIVATDILPVQPILKKAGSGIAVTTPIEATFVAGQRFGRRTFEGATRWCVYRTGAFQPPVDAEGRPFPTDCLEDRDGDGRFDRVLFFAYRAVPGSGILEAPITPVDLLPVQGDTPLYRLYRRLRTVALDGDRATFVLEHATMVPPAAEVRIDTLVIRAAEPPSEPVWTIQAGSERRISLHEGRQRILGLPVDMLKINGDWVATPAGTFDPWAAPDPCDDSRIRIAQPPAAD